MTIERPAANPILQKMYEAIRERPMSAVTRVVLRELVDSANSQLQEYYEIVMRMEREIVRLREEVRVFRE